MIRGYINKDVFPDKKQKQNELHLMHLIKLPWPMGSFSTVQCPINIAFLKHSWAKR